MKGRRGLELGPHLARIEGVARGAREAHVLARDTGANPLTREVRVHIGPAGEHIEPLGKQALFAEPVRLRFRRVGRRGSVEALSTEVERSAQRQRRLASDRSRATQNPAVLALGRRRSPFDQSRRTGDSGSRDRRPGDDEQTRRRQ